MKITKLSINRPVGAILVIIAVVALGFISIPQLPVSFWPEFVAPSLIIVAPYPGAGPEEIEETVAKPLEEELATLDGLDEIESICFDGACRIITRFEWGVDFADAKRSVQERVARATSRFPRMALQPTVLQVQDFIPPGLELSLTSTQRNLDDLWELVDKKVKNRILRLKEVAAVSISGGFEQHILISVKPERMQLYNISLSEVNDALAVANMDLPGGKFSLNRKNYLVRLKGKFVSLEEINKVVVSLAEKTPIYIQDIADVQFVDKERTSITRLNGKEIIGLAVRAKSGGNTVAMVDEVMQELENIRESLPPDVSVEVIRDQASFIKQSIRNVAKNAMIGAVFAGIIILLFLGNLRNTFIIALSIPISIIATFILLNQFGLSINTISLGGLALGVGLIVDASVVVLENIFRHLSERGDKPRVEVIVEATAQVGTAITSATLTSIVVFLPMAFMVGLFAVLLGELALTVVFSLSISIIVALTIVPMLSNKLMTLDRGRSLPGKISSGWALLFEQLNMLYLKSIRLVLRAPLLTLFLALLLLAGTIAVISPLLDVEMMPTINQDEYRIDVTLQEGTRLEETDALVKEIEKYLLGQERVRQVYATIGQTASLADIKTNVAAVTVNLKKEYVSELDQAMEAVRRELQETPGASFIIKKTTTTEGMEKEPINFRIAGDNLELLHELGDNAMDRIRDIPGVVNLKSTLEENLPEFALRINFEKAGQLGIPAAVIAATVNQAVLGRRPTTLSTAGKEYDITVKIDKSALGNLNELLSVPLQNVRGQSYPLGSVVSVDLSQSAGQVHRFDQQRVVIISADVAGRSQRDAREEAKTKLAGMPMPPDYYLTFGGQSKAIADSFKSMTTALIIAIFLVYVVMGAQFNSFRQPLIIAVTIPLALIGVYFGLFLFGASLSMNALLGMIMLVGIVVNNGILLVDYINQLQQQGKEKYEAIIQAGMIRFRPIMITSLTTIFGMLPIALGLGEGGEALQPLGAVVAGGLITSTFLTLLVIPCVYALLTAGPKRLK